MMLLPCIPELRVTDVTMPRPVLTFKDGQCIARFPAGLVLTLNFTAFDFVGEVRVSVAQSDAEVPTSVTDDLDAMWFLPMLSECDADFKGARYFGRIAAAPAGLLSIPVGTTIGLTDQQCSDLFALLEDAVVDMARAALSEVAA